MATRDDHRDILRNRVYKTFTFIEAVEFQKMLDRYATVNPVKWVDAKTGKPIALGYT